MKNLLEETIETLEDYGKKIEDIKWIGNEQYYMSIDTFKKIFNKEYDCGYGENEVNIGLIICGKDFWLERHEYDGAEWWEYKTMPKKPKIKNNKLNIFY